MLWLVCKDFARYFYFGLDFEEIINVGTLNLQALSNLFVVIQNFENLHHFLFVHSFLPIFFLGRSFMNSPQFLLLIVHHLRFWKETLHMLNNIWHCIVYCVCIEDIHVSRVRVARKYSPLSISRMFLLHIQV